MSDQDQWREMGESEDHQTNGVSEQNGYHELNSEPEAGQSADCPQERLKSACAAEEEGAANQEEPQYPEEQGDVPEEATVETERDPEEYPEEKERVYASKEQIVQEEPQAKEEAAYENGDDKGAPEYIEEDVVPPTADESEQVQEGQEQEQEPEQVQEQEQEPQDPPMHSEQSVSSRKHSEVSDAQRGQGRVEPEPATVNDYESFPPHTQEVNYVFKPRKHPYTQPSRWDPIEYDLREDSDDEFEMATAMQPVYEKEDSSEKPTFKNGEPDYEGEYLSCFDEPNLLYRILNRAEKKWAFYNDTRNYEMHVQFTFGKHSKLEPLENTTMHTKSTGESVAEVIVYPGETEMFVKGSPNGFTSKLRALPLSEEYYLRRQKLADEAIQQEISQIKGFVGNVTNSEEVLKACVENGIPFVDLEFPPCQASLDTGAKKPFKHLPWARPSSYLPDNMIDQVRLFRGPVRPADVDQGELGDNWLLCSIAAVSENPKSIINMFRHPTDPEMGKRERAVGGYRVTFNKNGVWRSVIVDDYLPVAGGKPKYAKSSHDLAEIWPCILQKAFAKLHGSYANICSGDPLHALQDITGRPCTRFDEAFAEASRTGKDDLFQDWVKYAKIHYLIILSTPGKDPRDGTSNDPKLVKQYKSVGLLTGHAYTVLDAKYFPEYELRLVKIRNAWGRGVEWNGDWCDDDEKWEQYPDVAEGCGFQKANDGTFWMTWEACLHYFNGGGVSFFQPSVNDYRVPSQFVECVPSCVLEVSVEEPTWMCLTISQQDKRGRTDVTEYQPVMLSVAEPAEDELYKVVQNSSSDAYHPLSDKWTFFQARDVSLLHKFLPEHSPYLLIPRLMPVLGQAEEVPYTLGFSCRKVVGRDGVHVNFKKMEKDNRVFHNYPKFDPEVFSVNVQYQAKMSNEGFPHTKEGSSVQ
ncbi:protein of unknown function DUF1935 [Trypanosoma melophagium]|uniref:protein of unknown function DUF1935 n=1 Tax=Trypanosoma melophagium TaxID=715481 RepID=UPI00351AA655|nr:protein of unknown function DUF1935 [Trypanosoma melophagium]